jgi:hypothetical protein
VQIIFANTILGPHGRAEWDRVKQINFAIVVPRHEAPRLGLILRVLEKAARTSFRLLVETRSTCQQICQVSDFGQLAFQQ